VEQASAMGDSDPLQASTTPLTFAAFLEKMRHPGAADIVKSIKTFLSEFNSTVPDAERDAERVQVRRLAPAAAFCAAPPCAPRCHAACAPR
jgi:hypothetical protein